ncbi:hypothetical protein CR513_30135, partial [Mucuna pruriens]
MIDAASGGELMDKMPVVARHLIFNMASNTQQFGIKGVGQPRMVNEIGAVDNLRFENQLTELTSLVWQLAIGQHQPSITGKVYGICTSMEHPIDMCPTLPETESEHLESVRAISGSQYGKAKPRAICNSTIWTYPKCTSSPKWLSAAELAIPDSTVPTTATTKNATSRQLTIS